MKHFGESVLVLRRSEENTAFVAAARLRNRVLLGQDLGSYCLSVSVDYF